MRPSKEVTTTTEVLDIPAPASIRHYVDVALKAARVPDSWLPQYEAATWRAG